MLTCFLVRHLDLFGSRNCSVRPLHAPKCQCEIGFKTTNQVKSPPCCDLVVEFERHYPIRTSARQVVILAPGRERPKNLLRGEINRPVIAILKFTLEPNRLL